METHSSTLAWKTPWTEEPGGLLSTGSQRVRHDLASKQQQQYHTYLNSCLIYTQEIRCIPRNHVIAYYLIAETYKNTE